MFFDCGKCNLIPRPIVSLKFVKEFISLYYIRKMDDFGASCE